MTYDALYLSPHLDDAALSCGGHIAQRVRHGEQVLIVTLMAGDPPTLAPSDYAAELHRRWELTDPSAAVATRRGEDQNACNILGASWRHEQWADCIYRLSPLTQQTMYHANHEIFGDIHPDEQEPLLAELVAGLATLPPAKQLIAPLTIGRHVDHQLVRLAAERWVGRETLLYYEDYPYACNPAKRTAVISQNHTLARTISISPADFAQKCHSIAAYQSQVSTFFASYADMEKQIEAYHTYLGGESLWRSTG